MANFNDSSVKFTSYKSVKNNPGLLPIQWHRKTITTADLDAAGTSDTVDVSTDDDGAELPDGSYVLGAGVKVRTPFSGGSVSALTVSLGDSGDPDELLTASDVYGASSGDWLETGGAYTPWTRESDYAVIATFASTGDNVDQLTAGEIEVWIAYAKLSDPST